MHLPLAAAIVADILDNASGVLMMTLAVGVVSAIAFAPLRPRTSEGPLDRLLIDIAIILSLGVGVMYAGLLVRGPAGSTAAAVMYLILIAVQVGWAWTVARRRSSTLLLAGIVINGAAVALAVGAVLTAAAAIDVLALVLLEGSIVALCAVLLWPGNRQRLASRVLSATASAGWLAVVISVVGMLVLLGLAGPGHEHAG